MRILITGGAGFIGCHLAEHLLAQGDEVAISGFGTFRVAARPAREGRNPQTGEPMKIRAGKTPRFTPGASLKRTVDVS